MTIRRSFVRHCLVALRTKEIPPLLYCLLVVSWHVKVRVNLWLTVYRQSIHLGVKPLEVRVTLRYNQQSTSSFILPKKFIHSCHLVEKLTIKWANPYINFWILLIKMPHIHFFYFGHCPLSRFIMNPISDDGSVSVFRQKGRYLIWWVHWT
jgi:hypothetical protein